MTIVVGTVVMAKRRTGVCDVGELGVCYEVYRLAGRPGYSFIFQSGRYDGFSPDDVEAMLIVSETICAEVAGYEFRNVTRLAADFEAGRFSAAFRSGDPWAARADEAIRFIETTFGPLATWQQEHIRRVYRDPLALLRLARRFGSKSQDPSDAQP